jgi:hypothetical protein
MAFRQDSEDSEDYVHEDEGDHYDYNNGIPPYEGAIWDDEFRTWASNPIDPEIYDEEGNYRIPPEDIVVEPTPVLAPAARQSQESIRDQFRRRRREMVRARAAAPVVAVPPPPPTPPIEDPRIVEARIGLPAPWEAHISNTYNVVYYFDPRNGNKQWERPTMGGKRRKGKTTRKRSRSKTRSKTNKKKRGTYRRTRITRRQKY